MKRIRLSEQVIDEIEKMILKENLRMVINFTLKLSLQRNWMLVELQSVKR